METSPVTVTFPAVPEYLRLARIATADAASRAGLDYEQIDDVRIILRSDHGTWIPCAEDLKKRGLNLNKCFRHVSSTHTKGMIADGQRVLIGSHNWSGGGVTLNRDASLLFDDREIAEYYREAFEIDWGRASHPTIPEGALTEAPRLADADGPVPSGFRRMSLEEAFVDPERA